MIMGMKNSGTTTMKTRMRMRKKKKRKKNLKKLNFPSRKQTPLKNLLKYPSTPKLRLILRENNKSLETSPSFKTILAAVITSSLVRWNRQVYSLHSLPLRILYLPPKSRLCRLKTVKKSSQSQWSQKSKNHIMRKTFLSPSNQLNQSSPHLKESSNLSLKIRHLFSSGNNKSSK